MWYKKPIVDDNGMSLLGKRWKGGLRHIIFSRLGLIILMFLIQALILVFIWELLGDLIPEYLFGGIQIFEIIVCLCMVNGASDPTSKISWMVLMFFAPLFGCMFYAWTKTETGHRRVKRRLNQLIEESHASLPIDEESLAELQAVDPSSAALAWYLEKTGAFPVHQNTKVTYFPLGDYKFEAMLTELEKAKDFIFMEYFIIEEGHMWGKILEILARKAKEGVDVRVMYDGTCEFSCLPHNYPKRIQALGIRCKMFSPLHPFVSTTFNYRDHRKILVIDGQVAFTGGVNLGDEYINQKVKFGHWKDTAIMLEGEAVPNLTILFLQMWSVDEKQPAEFERFASVVPRVPEDAEGFVVPYGDVPLDQDKVGEMVYMDILNTSADYVYIMTPYLILDGELETALRFTAERGVDVRMILPGIPDKPLPYAMARNEYKALLKAGVRIFEYTPGFVHAKVFVSDNKRAVVGTINLDFRSLYHHFECATYMAGTPCISEILADFKATQAQCREVTLETVKHFKLRSKVVASVAKVIAPML
jgi:cardiolipin synthase